MFSLIKNQVPLLAELEKDLSVTFRQMGDKNWIIEGDALSESCPFCGHHDCFRVHAPEGDNSAAFYKCFSCGEHGDVISWRAKHKSLSVAEAVRELAKEYDIKLPFDYSPVQQVFNLAADYYHACLNEACDKPTPLLGGLTPLRYQTEVRKRLPATLTRCKVGFSDGKLCEYLDSLGIDQEVILESGLMNKKTGRDYLPENCFIYPHFIKGKVSHFTFKDPLKKREYQLPKKFSLNGYLFYGQDSFSESDALVLVEGENDRLAVLEAGGGLGVFAIIGQISGEQLDWLRLNCKTKKIVTIFDPDSAGDKYREKVEGLRKFFAGLAHVYPPEDKDIDELLVGGGNLGEIVKNNLVKVDLNKVKPTPLDGVWGEGSSSTESSSNPTQPSQTYPTAPTPGNTTGVIGVVEDASILGSQEVPAPASSASSAPWESSGSNEVEVLQPAPPQIASYIPPNVPSEQDPDSDESTELVELEDCPIIQRKGCYWRVRYKDGVADYFRLSNFIIELKNVFQDEEGDRLREVVVRRQDGSRSKPFFIDSETKVSSKPFRVLAARNLDCEWMGKDSDLDGMWRLVYDQFPDVTINIPKHVGRHAGNKCWIFQNILITDNGVVVKPDDNNVFWISGKSVGIRPQSIVQAESAEGIPSLCTSLSREESSDLLQGAIQQLGNNLGNLGVALTCVGWIQSNAYSDLIFKANNGFGILNLR